MTEQETFALEEFTIANSMGNRIIERYHLKPQNFEVDLFRAKDDLEYKLDSTHMRWEKAALKGVNIHNIPVRFRYVNSAKRQNINKDASRYLR